MLFGFSINYSTYLAAETNHTFKKNVEQTLTTYTVAPPSSYARKNSLNHRTTCLVNVSHLVYVWLHSYLIVSAVQWDTLREGGVRTGVTKPAGSFNPDKILINIYNIVINMC